GRAVWFFAASRARPLRPSLPTRRSSDLRPATRHRGGPTRAEDDLGRSPEGPLDNFRRGPTIAAVNARSAPRKIVIARPGSYERLDRKSTRLNSSHVKISYAVFCLKKKKA